MEICNFCQRIVSDKKLLDQDGICNFCMSSNDGGKFNDFMSINEYRVLIKKIFYQIKVLDEKMDKLEQEIKKK